MKYKSTLLLLVAVAIAGLVAYSLSKKPTSLEATRARKKLLPDFQTADVKHLTIESDDGRIVCQRESAEEWRILEPLEVRADRWQVEAILDELETAERNLAYNLPEFEFYIQFLYKSRYRTNKIRQQIYEGCLKCASYAEYDS